MHAINESIEGKKGRMLQGFGKIKKEVREATLSGV